MSGGFSEGSGLTIHGDNKIDVFLEDLCKRIDITWVNINAPSDIIISNRCILMFAFYRLFFTARQTSCREVRFLIVSASVSHSFHSGSPMWPLPMHDALHLIVQDPPSVQALVRAPIHPYMALALLSVQYLLLLTSGGQDWRPVQTFTLENPPVLTSGGYWRSSCGPGQ